MTLNVEELSLDNPTKRAVREAIRSEQESFLTSDAKHYLLSHYLYSYPLITYTGVINKQLQKIKLLP